MALSTKGISHQIVSSLITYRKDGLGTINDCKVVVNHLIRKFSEPLEKEGLQQIFRSKYLTENGKSIKEHLFPVNEIMNHLLSINLELPKHEIADEIHDYLKNALVIVHVTESEDQKLNAHGFQRLMPREFFEPSSFLYKDVWARYKCAGIYESILNVDAAIQAH